MEIFLRWFCSASVCVTTLLCMITQVMVLIRFAIGPGRCNKNPAYDFFAQAGFYMISWGLIVLFLNDYMQRFAATAATVEDSVAFFVVSVGSATTILLIWCSIEKKGHAACAQYMCETPDEMREAGCYLDISDANLARTIELLSQDGVEIMCGDEKLPKDVILDRLHQLVKYRALDNQANGTPGEDPKPGEEKSSHV